MKRLENNKVTMVYKDSSFTLCAAKYPLQVIMDVAIDQPKKGDPTLQKKSSAPVKPNLEKQSSDGKKQGVKRKAEEIEEDDWSAQIPSKRAKNSEKSKNDEEEDFNPDNEEADPMDNVILPDSEHSSSD